MVCHTCKQPYARKLFIMMMLQSISLTDDGRNGQQIGKDFEEVVMARGTEKNHEIPLRPVEYQGRFKLGKLLNTSQKCYSLSQLVQLRHFTVQMNWTLLQFAFLTQNLFIPAFTTVIIQN